MTKLTVAFRNFTNTPNTFIISSGVYFTVFIFLCFLILFLSVCFVFTLQSLCGLCMEFYLYHLIYWLRLVSKFSVYIY